MKRWIAPLTQKLFGRVVRGNVAGQTAARPLSDKELRAVTGAGPGGSWTSY